MRRAAVAYARRGWPILPCAPGGKTPLIKRWPKRATINQSTIRRWWSHWPTANVAIATGGAARLLVIDVDPDKGGEDSLAALERRHGRLPKTLQVETPSRGHHQYFEAPAGPRMPGNSAGRLGKGIDTRGEGGYVLVPPSAVGGRSYSWLTDAPVAAAPTWLLERLEQGHNGEATPPEAWLELVTADIRAGERNQTLTRVAGLLLRYLPARHARVAAELVLALNQVRCRPPLAAGEVGLLLDSIAEAEARRRGLEP